MTAKSNSSIRFLDLDAVAKERPSVSLKLNGKKHELQPISVRTFVDNTKIIQNLSITGNIEEETAAIIKLIQTAFPTVPEEHLWELGFDQLRAIQEFAAQHNGQESAPQPEASTDENPQ